MKTIADFRRASFGHAMKHLLDQCERLGVANLWDTDLRKTPAVRAGALDGRTDRLDAAIIQALHHATHGGYPEAAKLLGERRRELSQLDTDAARFRIAQAVPTVDVMVLPEGWGRKGRGAKIIAAIRAEGLTANEVATRFCLALSTAKKYIRRAAKNELAIAA